MGHRIIMIHYSQMYKLLQKIILSNKLSALLSERVLNKWQLDCTQVHSDKAYLRGLKMETKHLPIPFFEISQRHLTR